MNGEATILDAHGQAVGKETQRGIEPDSNVLKQIGLHIAQDLAKDLATEMAAYVKRNVIPSGELHVNITTFKANKNKMLVSLTRQKDGIRIIGAPMREIKIEWGLRY